jgi:hypothetical protein
VKSAFDVRSLNNAVHFLNIRPVSQHFVVFAVL